MSDHGLGDPDAQNKAKAEQQAKEQELKKKTEGAISVAEQASGTNQTTSYAPYDSPPQSQSSSEGQGTQAVAATEGQTNQTASASAAPAAPADSQNNQAATPEKKDENLDQAAAKLENLSKKVSDSINGTPGSSLSMADMVNNGQQPE